MQKNYSKRYLLKAKQTLKRTRPSGEEGKQRTERKRRHAATRRGSFCFLFGSECEHHRREGVNEEDETSAIALLGVPEVQSQEDSEEEGGR